MNQKLFHQPLRLVGNRFFRSYLGGREIDRFRGIVPSSDNEFPEAWVGSATWSKLQPARRIDPDSPYDPKYGIAKVILPNGETIYMDDLLKSDPEGFLGIRHVKAHGTSPALLVKLLDAKDQLHLQAHPTREVAQRLFDSKYGKSEAWHIINVREDSPEKPYILMGFKEGITRERFEKLYDSQQIKAMEELCHKFEVQPGETYLIEAGLPHAVGPGCFLIEVQEPTDIGITARIWREKSDPENVLTRERVMNTLNFIGRNADETLMKYKVEPAILNDSEDGRETRLLGCPHTSYFGLTRLDVYRKVSEIKRDSFCIAIVIEGKGRLVFGNRTLNLDKADELFLPAGMDEAYWEAGEMGMAVIKAYPEGVL